MSQGQSYGHDCLAILCPLRGAAKEGGKHGEPHWEAWETAIPLSQCPSKVCGYLLPLLQAETGL